MKENIFRFRLYFSKKKFKLNDRILFFYITFIRRNLYNIFKKRYIEEQLKKRKGKCNQCGNCCRATEAIFIKCKYLKGNKCEIFDKLHFKRDPKCRLYQYPFDEKDKFMANKKYACGLYWGK